MQKQNKSIKIKVAIGYLLLTIVLLFSVWFVYCEMEKLSEPDDSETELNAKRLATNNTLAKLYQMEVIGQSLSAGRLNDYPLYKKAMTEALASIDSLKIFVSDSMQLQRIDSISLLLNRKGRNMISLLKAMDNSSSDQLYQENIERIITEQDSLLTQQRVQKKVVVHQNSYKVQEQKKKGFFKRLADAFSPDKHDTTTVTNTSQEFLTDTLVQVYNPADTVVGILKSIQIKMNDKRQERIELMRNKANNLRYNGQILTTKINQIIRDFEEEEVNRSLLKLEQNRIIRQRSMQTIGGIAIGSALLASFFLILIWRDITRSNRYRRELEVAKQRAEDLLVTREKLMLTITHDIKAPIGSVMGYIELLSRLTTEERQKFYLNNMKSSSEHLLKLVSDLLDFHKLDSNKMEINRVTFNPSQLFSEIKVSFDPIAARKNLKLNCRISPELDGHFISDPFRIRQVADNLLSNAMKFTKEGEVSLIVSYADSMLSFAVEDSGKGISEEEKKKIFQEFIRLSNAQGEEGFGLGLSITQKLVILLEGSIDVDSVVGKGSRFEVKIPLFPVAGEFIDLKQEDAKEITAINTNLRLLLIDDDKIQLELTAAMLKQQNIDSVCCERPDELIAALKNEHFDLLLTDVQMPALNGFELLNLLRRSEIPQAVTIPVVAVTARSDMKEQDFVEKGFIGCLHKPFSINDLCRMLSLLSSDSLRETNPLVEKQLPLSGSELNFSALTTFSEDDPDAAAEILKTFISETRKNKSMLEQALQECDAERIAALSHKMLPLFKMINATKSIEFLLWLEARRGVAFSEEMRTKTHAALSEIDDIILKGEKM